MFVWYIWNQVPIYLDIKFSDYVVVTRSQYTSCCPVLQWRLLPSRFMITCNDVVSCVSELKFAKDIGTRCVTIKIRQQWQHMYWTRSHNKHWTSQHTHNTELSYTVKKRNTSQFHTLNYTDTHPHPHPHIHIKTHKTNTHYLYTLHKHTTTVNKRCTKVHKTVQYVQELICKFCMKHNYV